MSFDPDIKTAHIALWGFVGTTIVLVLIFVMVVIFYQTSARLEYQRNISQPFAELETALENQRIRLVEYAQGDTVEVNGQSRTQFRIPIDEAMKILVAEWEAGEPTGPPRKPVERTAENEVTTSEKPEQRQKPVAEKPAEKRSPETAREKPAATEASNTSPQQDSSAEDLDDEKS